MKKVLLAVVLALFASVAQAQVTITPPATTTSAVDANWTRSGTDLSPTNAGDTQHLDGALTLNAGSLSAGLSVFGKDTTDFWGLDYTDWSGYTDFILIFEKSGGKNSAFNALASLPVGENGTLYGANWYAGSAAGHATNFAAIVGFDAYTEYTGSGTMANYLLGARGTVSWGGTAASVGYAAGLSSDVSTGTGAASLASLLGEKIVVTTAGGTTATTATGIDISFALSGTSTNAYGINIGNVAGATNNYAIKTGTGTVQFGDTTVFGRGATAQGVVWFLEDSDNGSNKVIVQPAASLAADYTVTLPAATGTIGLTGYGELYADSIAAPFTLALDAVAGTYEVLTHADIVAGSSAGTMTVDATGDTIDSTNAGVYSIRFGVSAAGAAAGTDKIVFAAFKEGVILNNCKIAMDMVSTTDFTRGAVTCMVSMAANDTIDIRVDNATDGTDIQISVMNFSLIRIGS